MLMLIDEFRSYLNIDKHNLDNEIVQQPSLLFEVSEAYAEAAAERDRLKEALAIVDATLDASVREELNGGKVTEAIVKNRIQSDPAHENSFNEYIEAKQKADVLGALKDAMHQRGYLIRDLAALYTANYFESNAVKETGATDAAVYKRQRQRLADARMRRE